MRALKVLIADDSVVYRSQIRAAMELMPEIEVVAAASNGRIALERLQSGPVDLLILDLEMPEMDGLQTLRELTTRALSCKVLVFSSASKRGAEITMDALRLGASDFIAKPGAEDESDAVGVSPAQRIRAVLEPKIRALFPDLIESGSRSQSGAGRFPRVSWSSFRPSACVIASSTGGPTALEDIFSRLQGLPTIPILIAQHMPPLFTAALAERLMKASGIPAREATSGERLQAGRIYVAPGDFHLEIRGTAEAPILELDRGEQVHSVRPAADKLFLSAVSVFGPHLLGLVLTGMGHDGKDGAEAIKRAGGAVLVQDQKSCVVFGMPGAVYMAGAYDKIGPPEELAALMQEKAFAGGPTSWT